MNEIYNKKEESLAKANEVYNQLISNSENLTNSQINQIDGYINQNTNNINASVDNNIADLTTANNQMQDNYQNELKGAEMDYNNAISLPMSETARIMAQNSKQNRQLVATNSREQAYQEYLNQSKQAKLIGDSTLAQLALEALKEKLNLNSTMNQYNSNLKLNEIENNRTIDNSFWSNQQSYNSALNSVNSMNENKRQFNETLAYQKKQDSIENALAQKEYNLALKEAQRSYYSSGSSGSSGGSGTTNKTVNITDTSNINTNNTTNTNSGNGKYYSNYTPRGLTSSATKVFNKLAKQSDSSGYVTASDIEKAVKDLPKDQQGLILSAFKSGTSPIYEAKKKQQTTSTKKTATSFYNKQKFGV